METIIREYGKVLIASVASSVVIALLIIAIKNIYVHRFVYASEEQNIEMTTGFANSLNQDDLDISFNRLQQSHAYDVSGIYNAGDARDAYWTLPNELENIYVDGKYVFHESGIYKIYIKVWNELGASREGYGNIIVN